MDSEGSFLLDYHSSLQVARAVVGSGEMELSNEVAGMHRRRKVLHHRIGLTQLCVSQRLRALSWTR